MKWIPHLSLSDINPVQTHRIREIKESPVLAYYGCMLRLGLVPYP